MTIRATIQLLLHVNELTNIQIPRQGLFGLEIELYQLINGVKNSGIPYQIIDNVFKPSSKARGKPDINDVTFRTKLGHIRYAEQTINLHDMVMFKLELDSFPYLNDNDIYLEFNLLFSANLVKNSNQLQGFQPSSIQTCRYKIQNIQNGIMHYSVGQFIQNYRCQFGFTVFSMVADYKFGVYNCPHLQPTVKEIKRQKIKDLQQLLQWAQKNYKNIQQPIVYMYETYLKPLCSNSYNFKTFINEVLKIKKEVKLNTSKKFNSYSQITDKILIEYLTTFSPAQLTYEDLRLDLMQIRTDNFFFIQEIVKDFAKDRFINQKLKDKFLYFMKEKFGEKVFKSISYGESLATSKQHLKIVKTVRNKDINLSQYPLISENLHRESQLVGFYQITYPQDLKNHIQNSNDPKSLMKLIHKQKGYRTKFYEQKNMMIVMCHGYQGSSYDMMMIQRGLKEVLPNANYMISICNQSNTNQDIEVLGKKLAEEIQTYIKQNMDVENISLNYIGHSMGGIIARASLKYLQKYEQKLGFFCSLGSPHLGYLNGVDMKIKTGLWLINKWQKVVSLDQLSMKDEQKFNNSFLYKLSYEGHLRNFQKIILINSMQDNFVPWHSARICCYQSGNTSSKIQKNMVDNILADKIVHRIDINFNCKKNNFDGFIGRTAHINLIVKEHLFKMLNWTIPGLFDLNQI